MATIIDFESALLSRDPEFRAQLDGVEACAALQAHFLRTAPLSPDEAAEALETIRRAIPLAEPTA